MNVIIFNRKKRLYFQALGYWVDDPEDSYVFKTCESALSFCHYHGLTDMLVMAVGPGGDQVPRKVPNSRARLP